MEPSETSFHFVCTENYQFGEAHVLYVPYITQVACEDRSQYLFVATSEQNYSARISKLAITDGGDIQADTSVDAHRSQITSVKFNDGYPHMFGTTAMDGYCRLWDSRDCTTAVSINVCNKGFHHTNALVHDLAFSGHLLAVNNDERVELYDLRKLSSQEDQTRRRPLLDVVVIHSESVSSLEFHPAVPHYLLSAADDGMVCTTDISRCGRSKQEDYYEDKNHFEANESKEGTEDCSQQGSEECCQDDVSQTGSMSRVSSVEDTQDVPAIPRINVVASMRCKDNPRKLKVIGDLKGILCTITATETINLLKLPGIGMSEPILLPDGKADVDTMLAVSRGAAAVGDFECECLLDDNGVIRCNPLLTSGESWGNIVDVVYDVYTERLYALGGSVNGHLLLFHVDLNGVFPVAALCAETAAGLSTGHDATVRCATVLRRPGGVVWATGAEDGRLCLWRQRTGQ